ncbi:hypothetical protein DSL72_000454 [Monilinia vaccinii-corymbosi]|uniref:Pre-rRNA-processing protein RIX1 n=1 Tax=Monilinia vaccinii-corymbosi TaxID=61207 RepID=A0A8A3P5V9_9HELO|nr:hypothetical protein DSL72_000454 [Monilinia vaccinii-corymbosi]
MSLPPELRILCLRLTSTPPKDLPNLTPTLVQYVLQCQIPLSNPSVNSGKAEASQSAVLVHKLKTQLTTLLNGKSAEGRFAAIVLIKVVVEVGGWEIVRGAGSWVRGMLSVLGKPDSSAAKELCIVALTKIYWMTHQYQTLVREITTPTLPTFVTSCLNLISCKPSMDVTDLSSSLVETVFQSFAMLLPRHTTIFRPFTSQLRTVTRPYLASTLCDKGHVSLSVKESARKLVVILHQAVAKNGGGEEWGKAVRDLVQGIHMTADQVFRAVIEDWESTAGYTAEPVNVDEELSGGARTSEDLSRWIGIDAGIERLVGLLEFLDEYLKEPTPSAVTIPVGSIFDVITRILSISIPSPTDSNSGNVRLHPAIDRDERDGLWTGLPKIFVSVLHLIITMSATLEQGFVSLAQGSLDLLTWSFSSGKNHQEFRAATYSLACKILPLVSQTLDKSRVSKLVPIMKACCKDLETSYSGISSSEAKSQPKGGSSQNADTLLHGFISTIVVVDPNVVATASSLLPVLLSDLPQGFLDISMRSQLERTAILGRNKEAMLASILNPFVGKNGKALASVLPHITRAFPNDDVVEILLRPRMPIIPAGHNHAALNDLTEDLDAEDDDMESIDEEALTTRTGDDIAVQNFPQLMSKTETGSPLEKGSSARLSSHNRFSTTNNHPGIEESTPLPTQRFTETQSLGQRTMNTDTVMSYDDADGSDSDSDGSVHLTMQLDSSDGE